MSVMGRRETAGAKVPRDSWPTLCMVCKAHAFATGPGRNNENSAQYLHFPHEVRELLEKASSPDLLPPSECSGS